MDIEQIRMETPGLSEVLHFENAGASLLAQPVIDAVNQYFQAEVMRGGYRLEDEFAPQLEELYRALAAFIGAAPEEIALSDSATRSWTSLVYSLTWQAGDVVFVSVAEYASNVIAFMQLEKRFGIQIQIIPNDPSGQVSVEALDDLLDKFVGRVKLVSITHIPTNGGLVNPAEAIGKITQQHNVLYLLDACQSIGQYPIDVEKIGCDFLTATGRKYLRAPRGTGFLYVRKKHLTWLEPLMLDLHGAKWSASDAYEMLPTAQRFEFWEKNYAALAGMLAAVKYAQKIGIANIWQMVSKRAEELRSALTKVPGISVCDRGLVKSGIVTFRHDSVSVDEIVAELRARKVNLSATTVYGTRFDMEERGLSQLVRTSVHYYNSWGDIERLIALLREVLGSSESQNLGKSSLN